MEANGLPSRTSILTAAARALGSREPDASVRNPDWVADRLIGPAELALIADHPISKALARDFQEAMHDPDVFGFIWLMLVRTRCIDGLMERAVRNGATQLVILGAGFDTRAQLRQYFPKKTDLSGYSQADLDKVALCLNQRPRKTLGFETPASKLQASVASIH